MSRRFLELIAVAAVFMAVVVLLKLAPVPVVGQTPAATAPAGAATKAGPAPNTSWGDPDLQGLWSYDFEVPLQRPARYANQEFFTDEEQAELDRQRAGILNQSDRRYAPGSEQDVGGAYNAAIFTTHKRTGRRTSLIVDPPDGRIPPLTPEAQKKRAAIREFQLALLQATNVCKEQTAGLHGRDVRAAIAETSGNASALPDGRRGRGARGRRRRHQSLRQSRGPQPRGALHGGCSARFWWEHRFFPSDCAVAWDRVDFL